MRRALRSLSPLEETCNGRSLLIASHGNSLRALIMALQGMDPSVVESFDIPTGVPIAHLFSAGGSPLGWHYLDTGGRRAA